MYNNTIIFQGPEASPEESGKIILVCGLPGAGKSTLIKNSIQAYPSQLEYIKDYTTRPIRLGEDDSEYIFVDDDELDIIASEAKDWQESPGYGNRYGHDTDYFRQKIALGTFVIGCSHPSIDQVESLYPFYGPSSIVVVHLDVLEEVRNERLLVLRGKEGAHRLERDKGWQPSAEYSERVDATFSPIGVLSEDIVSFRGLIRSIMTGQSSR